MKSHHLQEKGQGLVEYALLLILVAIVVMGILTILGPQVGDVFSRVIVALSPPSADNPLTGVTAVRTGHGHGNDVVVTATVSENTTVTVTDSQSGQSFSMSCSNSCQQTMTGVGHHSGTVTATAGSGSLSAGYGHKD
jgi:pilus assembly protein Flp/PilA